MILYSLLLTGVAASAAALLHPRPASRENARLLAIAVALIAMIAWRQW